MPITGSSFDYSSHLEKIANFLIEKQNGETKTQTTIKNYSSATYECVNVLESLAENFKDKNAIANYHFYRDLAKKVKLLSEDKLKTVISELNDLRQLCQQADFIYNDLEMSQIELRRLGSEDGIYDRCDASVEESLLSYYRISKKIISKAEALKSGRLLKEINNVKEGCFKQFKDYADKNKDDEVLEIIKSLYVSEISHLHKKITNFLNEVDLFIGREDEAIKLSDTFLCENLSAPALSEASTVNSLPSLKGKSVLAFTCSYGQGHNSVAAALTSTLKQAEADIKVCDLTTGLLLKTDDVLYKLSKKLGIKSDGKYLSSIQAFNKILRNQLYWMIDLWQGVDLAFRRLLGIGGRQGVINPATNEFENSVNKQQIRKVLLAEKPDCIITTYHMHLNGFLEVAQELGIPVIHLATDADGKFWEIFDNKRPTYKYFKSTIPTMHPKSLHSCAPLTSDQLIQGVGILLRPEFYKTLTAEQKMEYRVQRKIKPEEKVVVLTSGGNGQSLPHPEYLANSSTWRTPIRIEVIAGRNIDYVKHLMDEQLSHLKPVDPSNPYILQGKNPNVTIEIVRNEAKQGTPDEFFVEASELSKLYDIADGACAKAGGVSFAELTYKGVPILFDCRITPVTWERFNISLVTEDKVGIINKSLNYFEQDLEDLLKLPKQKHPHYYFESSQEILCKAIADQIEEAAKANEEHHSSMNKEYFEGERGEKNLQLFQALKKKMINGEEFVATISQGDSLKFKSVKEASSQQVLKGRIQSVEAFLRYITEEYQELAKTGSHPADEHFNYLVQLVDQFIQTKVDPLLSSEDYFLREKVKNMRLALLQVKLGGQLSLSTLQKNPDFVHMIFNSGWDQLAGKYDQIFKEEQGRILLLVNGKETSWEEVKKLAHRDGSKWIDQNGRVNGCCLTYKGLVDLDSLDSLHFIPFYRLPVAKRQKGGGYTIEVMTAIKKNHSLLQKENQTWLRMINHETGEVYSHNLKANPKDTKEKHLLDPYDQINFLTEEWSIKGTPISIDQNQFNLLKQEIEKKAKSQPVYRQIDYNSASHIVNLMKHIGVQIQSANKVADLVEPHLSDRLSKIIRYNFSPRIRHLASQVLQVVAGAFLKLTAVGRKNLKANDISKDPSFLSILKNPELVVIETPLSIRKWQEEYERELKNRVVAAA